MPPKKSPGAPKKPTSGGTRLYLFLYNLISFSLWATCTVRTALLLAEQFQENNSNGDNASLFDSISLIFPKVFPLLLLTQSLAGLEILHSLIGLVRAPVVTTAMQVSSRFVVVWGVMYLFREGAEEGLSLYLGPELAAQIVDNGDGLVGVGGLTQYCDFAFLGCMFAWGITECIRYGFFAMQLGGVSVPGWWQWLRYNTFFVLYPIGISSECVFMYFSLGHAERYVHEYYKWLIIGIMAIYVPGSYILYTHMMSQRRRVMRGKSRVD